MCSTYTIKVWPPCLLPNYTTHRGGTCLHSRSTLFGIKRRCFCRHFAPISSSYLTFRIPCKQARVPDIRLDSVCLFPSRGVFCVTNKPVCLRLRVWTQSIHTHVWLMWDERTCVLVSKYEKSGPSDLPVSGPRKDNVSQPPCGEATWSTGTENMRAMKG